jgi:hypothetical protein
MANNNNRFTLFTILAGGDIEKEKRMWLISLKIIYDFWLCIIPAGILVLTIIFPIIGYIRLFSMFTMIFSIYIFSSILMLIGYGWRYIFKDQYFYSGFLGVAASCVFRATCFEIGIVLAFVMGMANISWIAFTPIFIIEGIALILSYPTTKKWEQWLAKLPVSN